MRRVLVRYKVKPERVEEHEALIRAVFEELKRTAPSGLRYGTFKQPDGLSFVHFALVAAEPSPLTSLTAFQAFIAKVSERCDEPPVTVVLTEVGSYGFEGADGSSKT
ncbi:MAG TPA: hypothetical protein VHU40_15175 [Polyangia bacterium]|jgi:quinol monooxygenase YgiN|nr:hypothetical protein [Polyangia bacterium]